MTSTKLSVSVPDDVAAWLASQPNASAAITAAVRAKMAGADLGALLSAHGVAITDSGKASWRERLSQPIPADTVAAADDLLRRVRSLPGV